MIIASAANDGAALPLLYLPLTILTGRQLLKDWLIGVVVWKVLGSLLLGGICGRLANRMLRFSENHGFIDKESFVVFSLALSVSHSIIKLMFDSFAFLAFGRNVNDSDWQ